MDEIIWEICHVFKINSQNYHIFHFTKIPFKQSFCLIHRLTQAGLPNWVYSGVAIWYKDLTHKFTEVTTVYMLKLDEEEILSYVETGEPL